MSEQRVKPFSHLSSHRLPTSLSHLNSWDYTTPRSGRKLRRRPVWQPCLANLIEQSPIADLEGSSRLLAVPVLGLQGFEDDLALQVTRRLSADLLERNRPTGGPVGRHFRLELARAV